MSKPKLLWIGDAVVNTGFARVTHNVLAFLCEQWDVSVMGLGYSGDPHSYPYPIYPAKTGYDIWGFKRYRQLVEKIKPDCVCIINDPVVVARYLAEKNGERVAAYIPVDGILVADVSALNDLDAAIWYTNFGKRQGELKGYQGESHVVSHGVDLSVYRPIPKLDARTKCEIPLNGFIVGNVNRNQTRKRLDLTVRYFAEWVKGEKLPKDVRLWIHASRKDEGCDFQQLAQHYGIADRLITSGDIKPGHGIAEFDMPYVYNCFDVQINTGTGEGWGLTTMEGMACGILQIVGNWSALAEWTKNAVARIDCDTTCINSMDTIGGVPNEDDFIAWLDSSYRNYQKFGKRWRGTGGRELVSQPEFRWQNIAKLFHEILSGVIERTKHESVNNGSNGKAQASLSRKDQGLSGMEEGAEQQDVRAAPAC